MRTAASLTDVISYLARWAESHGLEMPFALFRESLSPFSSLFGQGSPAVEPLLVMLADGIDLLTVESFVPASPDAERPAHFGEFQSFLHKPEME